MEEYLYNYHESPLGKLEIKFNSTHIFAFHFMNEEDPLKEISEANSLCLEAVRQLNSYFNGSLKQFNLPLKLEGTSFQEKVWTELCTIDYGKTISYLQLAKQLGDEKCIRAAASANGKNPFGIVIPCHRVIGTNGSLTGYAGQLWRKQWLLEHEAKVSGSYQKLF